MTKPPIGPPPKKHWTDDYRDIKDFFAIPEKPVIRYSVWRVVEDNTLPVPLFVTKDEVAPGDLVFTESDEFEGYAKIRSFTKDKNGDIVNWDLKAAGYPLERENKMLHVVQRLIHAAAEQGVRNVLIYLGLKEKVEA